MNNCNNTKKYLKYPKLYGTIIFGTWFSQMIILISEVITYLNYTTEPMKFLIIFCGLLCRRLLNTELRFNNFWQ